MRRRTAATWATQGLCAQQRSLHRPARQAEAAVRARVDATYCASVVNWPTAGRASAGAGKDRQAHCMRNCRLPPRAGPQADRLAPAGDVVQHAWPGGGRQYAQALDRTRWGRGATAGTLRAAHQIDHSPGGDGNRCRGLEAMQQRMDGARPGGGQGSQSQRHDALTLVRPAPRASTFTSERRTGGGRGGGGSVGSPMRCTPLATPPSVCRAGPHLLPNCSESRHLNAVGTPRSRRAMGVSTGAIRGADDARQDAHFAHVAQEFRVRRERTDLNTGVKSIEYAYGITSLAATCPPQQLLAWNRGLGDRVEEPASPRPARYGAQRGRRRGRTGAEQALRYFSLAIRPAEATSAHHYPKSHQRPRLLPNPALRQHSEAVILGNHETGRLRPAPGHSATFLSSRSAFKTHGIWRCWESEIPEARRRG